MSKYVCDQCVNDPVLAELVRKKAESLSCSYCLRRNRKRPLAADLEEVRDFIHAAVYKEFTDDFDGEIPYDSEDNCYLEDGMEIGDILSNHFEFRPENDKLFEDLVDSFEEPELAKIDQFCGTPNERAMETWEHFCHVVKHLRRFTFWDLEAGGYDCSPTEMIDNITKDLKKQDLIREMPVGSVFWRVRCHPETETLTSADEFSSTPDLKAAANRMSPAGIPMFYGANTFETSCLEVVGWHHKGPDSEMVTGMCFESVSVLNVLDLTSLPKPRSGFEPWDVRTWHDYMFLRDFVSDVSKPIDKNGNEQIQYVPTQVFTEYVRFRLCHGDQPIHGMMYPSCYDKSPCVVIFATKEQCQSHPFGPPQLLLPLLATRKSIAVTKVKQRLAALKKASEPVWPRQKANPWLDSEFGT